ncbi:tetratricopeptide repeat protein [Microbispora sp. H10885]|uniref:tetratricopeptide repeat protein n=1 Tax=Microbispora sp. H10885 TaxID=2729110 RepID=UPI001601F1AF|nr:tetratricopeptide repeat protein [Microbispora sp. H10885]
MDAGLFWTVVGSAAGVIGAISAVLQLRRHDKEKASKSAKGISAQDVALDPRAILRPPVGRLPRVFRDRKAVRRKLRKVVRRPDGKVHLLYGLGGSGKTAIAIKTAQEAADKDRMVWWVSGVSSSEFVTSMLQIAGALGARESEMKEVLAGRGNSADLLWRHLARHKKWLLVIDNVDDIRVLDVGAIKAGDGNGWLRPTRRGTMLVTSRLGDPSQWGTFTQPHEVGPLDPQDAALMLRDLAPASGSDQEAEVLAGGLGCLPLALRHVGSLLSSPFSSDRSFAAYSSSLRTNLGSLMKRGGSERDILARTWESSLDMLTAQGRGQARPILRTLSCFAPSIPIPTGMLDERTLADLFDGGDVEAVAEGLKALESVKLIDVAEGPPVGGVAIVVHPLIAEANRLHLDGGRETSLVTKVCVGLVLHAIEGLKMEEPADWPRWFEILPHMMSVMEQVSRHPVSGLLGEVAKCVARAVAALVYAGHYTTALEVTRTALSLARGLGEADPGLLELRHELAGALYFTGDTADAEREYRAVAEARSKTFGEEDPQTLISLFQVAFVLAMTERPDEAEKVARRVLEVRSRVLDPGDYYLLVTRYLLDDILLRQGKFEECRQRCIALLDDVREVLGAENFLTITTRHLLARVLLEQGELREAEAELRAVLNAGRETLGDRHPELLRTRLTLARTLATTRRKREARAELDRVLTMLGGSVAEAHPLFRDFQLAEDALAR